MRSLILRLLTCRIGKVAPELRSQVQTLSLSLEELGELDEALLDLSAPGDLARLPFLKKAIAPAILLLGMRS